MTRISHLIAGAALMMSVGIGAALAETPAGGDAVAAVSANLPVGVTLDKTVGHFSPTTRYRDHAISPELIHWESQSATRACGARLQPPCKASTP